MSLSRGILVAVGLVNLMLGLAIGDRVLGEARVRDAVAEADSAMVRRERDHRFWIGQCAKRDSLIVEYHALTERLIGRVEGGTAMLRRAYEGQGIRFQYNEGARP